MQTNLKNALKFGLFLNAREAMGKEGVPMETLLLTICGLSYRGDLRMRMKMENANKVKNIVEGNKEQLSALYLPKALELQEEGMCRITNDGNIKISMACMQDFFDNIPSSLKKGMKRSIV